MPECHENGIRWKKKEKLAREQKRRGRTVRISKSWLNPVCECLGRVVGGGVGEDLLAK